MTVFWLLTPCFCGVPGTVRAPEGGDLLSPLWHFFFLSGFFFPIFQKAYKVLLDSLHP